MTITNPGAIPNSGSKKFTAQLAQVALINYNRNLNNEEYNAYINSVWYANNAGSTSASTPGNSFGNLQAGTPVQQNFINENNLVHKYSCKKKKDKKKYKKCY